MIEATSLPDLDTLDIAALKALILAQQKQHADVLRSHTSEIEHLTLQVEKLRRMLFGASSEKVHHRIEQLEFELEELETAVPKDE